MRAGVRGGGSHSSSDPGDETMKQQTGCRYGWTASPCAASGWSHAPPTRSPARSSWS
ncbi:MAG: hypothetical protein MZV64_15385 [Ignavibacteriales bacterium]|nr:hypothetical protein [Ignavibacteriales bacterium]